MLVADLEGALLDYWVAKALADRLARIVGAEEHERCETRFGDQWPWNRFSPSSAWTDGGPIIEREEIMICKDGLDVWGAMCGGIWHPNDESSIAQGGQQVATPLISAMRAYVASKFGEEVEDIDAPHEAGN